MSLSMRSQRCSLSFIYSEESLGRSWGLGGDLGGCLRLRQLSSEGLRESRWLEVGPLRRGIGHLVQAKSIPGIGGEGSHGARSKAAAKKTLLEQGLMLLGRERTSEPSRNGRSRDHRDVGPCEPRNCLRYALALLHK